MGSAPRARSAALFLSSATEAGDALLVARCACLAAQLRWLSRGFAPHALREALTPLPAPRVEEALRSVGRLQRHSSAADIGASVTTILRALTATAELAPGWPTPAAWEALWPEHHAMLAFAFRSATRVIAARMLRAAAAESGALARRAHLLELLTSSTDVLASKVRSRFAVATPALALAAALNAELEERLQVDMQNAQPTVVGSELSREQRAVLSAMVGVGAVQTKPPALLERMVHFARALTERVEHLVHRSAQRLVRESGDGVDARPLRPLREALHASGAAPTTKELVRVVRRVAAFLLRYVRKMLWVSIGGAVFAFLSKCTDHDGPERADELTRDALAAAAAAMRSLSAPEPLAGVLDFVTSKVESAGADMPPSVEAAAYALLALCPTALGTGARGALTSDWKTRQCAASTQVELLRAEANARAEQTPAGGDAVEEEAWIGRWMEVRRSIAAREKQKSHGAPRGFAYVQCESPGAPIELKFHSKSPWPASPPPPRFEHKISSESWRAFNNLGGNALLLVPPRRLRATGLTDFALDYDEEEWRELGRAILCAWPPGRQMFTHGHGEPYLHVRFELLGVRKSLTVMHRALNGRAAAAR